MHWPRSVWIRLVASAAGVFAAAAVFATAIKASNRVIIATSALALALVIVVLLATVRDVYMQRRGARRRAEGPLHHHFEPKARGVARRSQPGRYFTGRRVVLEQLVEWLTAEQPEQRLCVVTAAPGSGKSAVLARLVLRSRGELKHAAGPEQRLSPGCIDVVVHAQGQTLAEIVSALAAAVHVDAITAEELIAGIAARGRPLVVLVDALDEAARGEAGAIARKLLKPLAGDAPVKVLVGTRRGFRDELLVALGPNRWTIDLDAAPYFAPADLSAYAKRRLLCDDEPHAPTPYRGAPELAERVAARIAARAEQSFLVAQLVSQALVARRQVVDVDQPGWDEFPTDVEDAMELYLDAIEPDAARRRAQDTLTALAFAEGAGLRLDDREELWPKLAGAIAGERYSSRDVRDVLDSAAGDLVEVSSAQQATYRLFHQALIDHLRAHPRFGDPQRRILAALIDTVPMVGREGENVGEGEHRDWERAAPYIRAHLATHAAAAGQLQELVEDARYLTAADPPALLHSLSRAPLPAVATTATIIRAYRRAAHALRGMSPLERAAQLELAARQAGATTLADELARCYPERPWSVPWAHWRQDPAHFIAGMHDGTVNAVAIAQQGGDAVIVSAGEDGAIRLWELASGAPRGEPLFRHAGPVHALAVCELDRRPLLISGGEDGTVLVWDLAAEDPVAEPLTGHEWSAEEAVLALSVGELGGDVVVVAGGSHGAVWAWSLVERAPRGSELGHPPEAVLAVAVGELAGAAVVVSGGDASMGVQVWDLATGEWRGALPGHHDWVNALVFTQCTEGPVLVTGDGYGTVRVWDEIDEDPLRVPLTGEQPWINAMAVAQLGERRAIITGDDDGVVRAWDLADGNPLSEPFTGHDGSVRALAAAQLGERQVVVSGGRDGTVRVWELAADGPVGELPTRYTGPVMAVAAGELREGTVVVSGGTDGMVRVWDLADGAPRGKPVTADHSKVNSIALGELDGEAAIFAVGDERVVRAWDLAGNLLQHQPLASHTRPIRTLAAGELQAGSVIVTGADEVGKPDRVQVWDLSTGLVQARDLITGLPSPPSLDRRRAVVHAVAAGMLGGHPAIVAGYAFGAASLWELVDGVAHERPLTGQTRAAMGMAVGELDGQATIVAACNGVVLVWGIAGGSPREELHTVLDSWMRAVVLGRLGGGGVIIAGGEDRALWVWNHEFELERRIDVGAQILDLALTPASVIVATVAGLMAIELRRPPRCSS